MKLTNLALIVAFAAGMAVPAYAATKMDKAQEEAMKAEMAQAGATDEARMAYFKGLSADKQASWKKQCNTAEFTSLSEDEIKSRGDIPSFCKAILK
jgi:hypothetical protein